MWGALLGGVASGLIGAAGQSSANSANRQEATKQRMFQERMSNTAHTREAQDLRAAGLNPILSATKGSGASTPVGAKADIKSETEAMANSAASLAMQSQQIKLLTEQTRKTKNEADLTAPKARIAEQIETGINKILGLDLENSAKSVKDAFNPKYFGNSTTQKKIPEITITGKKLTQRQKAALRREHYLKNRKN